MDPNALTPEQQFKLAGESAPGFRVSFFENPELDHDASRAEGRPIYVTRMCVRIKVNGDRDVTTRLARKDDFLRWPDEYEAFKQARHLSEHHTPIQALVPIGRSTVAALREMGCLSVQQLAEANPFTDQRDWDMEIMRKAACAISTIIQRAKDEREQRANEHLSEEEIAQQVQRKISQQHEEEHFRKVAQFNAQKDFESHHGPAGPALPIPRQRDGAGASGQDHHGADAFLPSQGQGANGKGDWSSAVEHTLNFDREFTI